MTDPKRILITGADGFIGRHLLAALHRQGKETLAIDIASGNDLCDEASLRQVGSFDALVHLAGKTFVPDSFASSGDFFSTNILGTINALELCKKNNARFITLSSYVYGTPQYLPIDEAHPVSMWNPYAASKLIAENLAQAYNQNFHIPATILRVFNVFGKGQKEPFLIPKVIAGLRKGRLVLQDPAPRRDYVYVLDLVDAIRRALSRGGRGYSVYNIGSGVSHSVSEVVAIAKDAMRSEVEVEFSGKARQADIMDVVADIAKARRELGWEPRFDLRSGLADAFANEPGAAE